ncbi:MAG: DUF429 domain-containing protein [Planctomycetota bacterium]|nr:DUF429 domain-containing protein [Planctomycetota bacterium]
MSALIIHGVDYSGAKSGGGSKIVIATRDAQGSIALRRGVDRPELLRTIRTLNDDGDRHLWRIDAPISLPESVLEAHGVPCDWRSMAHWMRSFDSARDWRRALRAVDRKERKRTCDRAAKAPLAPMNLRVFKQTWTAVCELLLPLAEEGFHIAPVHPTDTPSILTEACPASVLDRIGESSRGYKGRDAAQRARRRELCGVLAEHGLDLSDQVIGHAERDGQGDVVDALLLLLPPVQEVVPREASLEGWIW